MAGAKLVSLVVLVMLVAGPMSAQATITCGQVTGALAPCIGYLRSGGTPTAACCNGVKAINSAAKTPADRQQACKCLKSASSSISGINYGNAAALPGKCGVNVPYKISPSTNCDNIK